MADPGDLPATKRDIMAIRLLITALGQALVKQGAISHADVASELSPMIQALGADAELKADMAVILGSVVTWG